MITDKQFIDNANEEEILSVIESFLNRLRDGNNLKCVCGLDITILDKVKVEIIKEMKKDFKKYSN